MRSAFLKDLLRSVRGSLGRFLAIMGITALGCGFYAGLQMSGPDMRAAGDAFYDGTSLYDIRLVSTLGFANDDVARVAAIEGAGATMPAITCDAMAKLGQDRLAVRISSLDVESAQKSEVVSDYAISSDNKNYLNRLFLREGRWPVAVGECVITADKDYPVGFGVGDVVEVLYGTQDLDDLLATRTFTVVGRVSSSYYPYTGSFGSTSLGSGMVGQYLYVAPESFSDDAPFTEVYVEVPDAEPFTSGSDDYQAIVSEVKERYEHDAERLATARLADVKKDAQDTLDEKYDEYLAERADAERQLADAKAELDDAKQKLADGKAELDDAAAELADGERQLAEGKRKLDDSAVELANGRRQLDDAEAQLASAKREIDDGERQLAASKRQLDDAEAQLASGKKVLDESAEQLADAKAQLEAGERELEEGQASYEQGVKDLEEGREQAARELEEGQRQLDENERLLDDAEEQLGMTQQDIDEAMEELAQGEQEWSEQRAALLEAEDDLDTCMSALEAVVELTQVEGTPTQDQIDACVAQVQTGIAAAQDLLDSGLIDVEDEEALVQLQALLEQASNALEFISITGDTIPPEILAQLREVMPGIYDEAASATESTVAQIEDGIAQGDATIAEARSQLELAQETRDLIDNGREELERGRQALAEGQEEAARKLEEGQRKLDEAAAELAAARQKLDDGKAEYEKGKEAYQVGLSDYQKGYEDYQKGLALYNEGYAEFERGRTEYENGRATYLESKAAYEDGLVQYQEGLVTYEQSLADYQDGLAKYRDGVAEYERGRAEYEDGLAEYLDARAEADEKFSDAEAQLADAQREIDELEKPDIYALDRSQSEGAVTYNDDTLRMDSIADVFPFMFFLVAALVSLTTMTRMVEDDRILIGTYKALGYSKGKIAAKYLAYAGAAGAVGATVGIAVLSQVLPYIVIISYGIIYAVPIHGFPMPISAGIALLSGGLGVGVTLLATWFAVVSSLRETPATLMLPRAPKAGKRILLERIGPIWRRLSFSWKVTCRNMFRYKRRMSMTIIGIAGCTALLLTGFGLHDSIWDIIDNQYGPIVHFDTTIGLDDDAIVLDADRVESYLSKRGDVNNIARMQQENMQAGAKGYDGALMRVSVIIPRTPAELDESQTLHNRLGHYDIGFDDDSVVITEKLSMKLGLDVGDEVVIYDQDTVGNAIGSGYALTVTGVAENYVGSSVFVGRNVWKTVDVVPPVFQTIYCNVSPEGTVRELLSEDLQDMDNVSTVIFSDETINLYRNMLRVVDLIVVVLIVSAAALAFIVLYNLTNINVSERVREIASLKVLGFTNGEVYAYIFREIALLSVVGDALGMVLGTWMARFVVTTAEVDYVMFGRTIHWPSYCYAFVLTLVFTVLVIFFMRKKLDNVNMVESLKSVD
ncbi:MAG: FtsX-like permease family protein [Coriobacteriales bacterium]|nr:FtsX-like permease family protein [Coriobacteriales bacterium]